MFVLDIKTHIKGEDDRETDYHRFGRINKCFFSVLHNPLDL